MPSSTALITNKTLKDQESKLTHATGDINLVMLGCPHYTYKQILEVERLFAEGKYTPNTAFWILAESGAVELAERSRVRQKLELLGVRMVGNMHRRTLLEIF